jgi:predicted CXXCH cytochrome family protein
MDWSMATWIRSLSTIFLLAVLASIPCPSPAYAQVDDPAYCLDCHSDPDIENENGESVFVDTTALHGSVHKEVACIDCHDQEGADFEDVPHFTVYKPVNCETCHPSESFIFMEYFDKMLRSRGNKDIPACKDCHGTHNAQRQLAMEVVCERCHQKEADDYKKSYHFKKYAEDPRRYPICTTCHDPHFKSKKEVMSEIEYKQEILDICSRCHQRDIETYVHSRHYHELEAGNPKAPVCTSCHEKHDIRKPSDPESRVHAGNITDVCNGCHPGYKKSLHVAPGMDPNAITCASCHTGHQTDMVSINNQIFKEGGIYNQCVVCHSRERHAKESLAHGEMMLVGENGEEANCTHCHTYHWNLPGLDVEKVKHRQTECANCHAEQNRDYKKSIHGRARAQGIMEAPSCTDCHGETDIKKVKDQFTPEGVVQLCGSCHSNRELMLSFRINPYVVEGYKETYHGKLFELGTDVNFSVCTNCHGHHTILPPDDPKSTVNRANIVKTCKQCHPRANENFVSYLVHPKQPTEEEFREATHRTSAKTAGEPSIIVTPPPATGWEKFNVLVTKFMTLLLVAVMTGAGVHTVLWFQRGIRPRMKPRQRYYRRIDGFHRFLHVLVNVSFLTLAFTGLPQSYAHTDLAKWLFTHIISLQTAQKLHYIAAAVTGFYFLAHVVFLVSRIRKSGLRAMLTGPETMMFRWKDVKDAWQHLMWFFGRARRPLFDRWTYWEKFDYFAVFWGVFVIGLSGLLRWKEEFFGSLLGGGLISLADTIHKEEALLATAFIFMIHFFNTHLRASKFPMDVSIYTGSISEKEFKEERPIEFKRMENEGRLVALEAKPPSVIRSFFAYLWGTIALLVGFFLLALIIIGHFTAR